MPKKRWGVLLIVLGGLLLGGQTARGQENSSYNGKIAALMQHYFNIQRALSKDSLQGVAKNARALVKQAQEIRLLVADRIPAAAKRKLQYIKKSAGALRGGDITAIRRNFKILSEELIEFMEMVGVPDSLKSTSLYVFYCPQADGRWIQPDPELANPFYGKLMLKSGHLEGPLQGKVTAAYNGL